MTKNEKVTAGIVGGLALVLAVGAYEFSTNNNRAEAPTAQSPGVLPNQTSPNAGTNNSAVLPATPSPVVAPRQWRSVAPGTPVGPGPAAVVPSQNVYSPTTVVRTPSGAFVPSATLQAEQPALAPQSQTTVSSTEAVAPAPYPASTVTTTRTVATVPETTTQTHRVYVHRTVRYRKHHSSGKVHVARAVKHTVMFTAKLPGRLRI
ncbi:MAG TPA: hypothetical protein V6C69_19385 [Trichormus sp.]|jgi:hypothetical protein